MTPSREPNDANHRLAMARQRRPDLPLLDSQLYVNPAGDVTDRSMSSQSASPPLPDESDAKEAVRATDVLHGTQRPSPHRAGMAPSISSEDGRLHRERHGFMPLDQRPCGCGQVIANHEATCPSCGLGRTRTVNPTAHLAKVLHQARKLSHRHEYEEALALLRDLAHDSRLQREDVEKVARRIDRIHSRKEANKSVADNDVRRAKRLISRKAFKEAGKLLKAIPAPLQSREAKQLLKETEETLASIQALIEQIRLDYKRPRLSIVAKNLKRLVEIQPENHFAAAMAPRLKKALLKSAIVRLRNRDHYGAQQHLNCIPPEDHDELVQQLLQQASAGTRHFACILKKEDVAKAIASAKSEQRDAAANAEAPDTDSESRHEAVAGIDLTTTNTAASTSSFESSSAITDSSGAQPKDAKSKTAAAVGTAIVVSSDSKSSCSAASCSAATGSAVSGSAVSGSAVSGSAVSGSAVSGSAVSGSATSGSAVSGSAVSGSAVSGSAVSGPAASDFVIPGNAVPIEPIKHANVVVARPAAVSRSRTAPVIVTPNAIRAVQGANTVANAQPSSLVKPIAARKENTPVSSPARWISDGASGILGHLVGASFSARTAPYAVAVYGHVVLLLVLLRCLLPPPPEEAPPLMLTATFSEPEVAAAPMVEIELPIPEEEIEPEEVVEVEEEEPEPEPEIVEVEEEPPPMVQPVVDPTSSEANLPNVQDGDADNRDATADPKPPSKKPPAKKKPHPKPLEGPPHAVIEGNFAVWASPARPLPGQSYAIYIRIRLPDRIDEYRRCDLSGFLVGSDGYRKSLASENRDLIPIIDHTVTMAVPVVAANAVVADAVLVRSKYVRQQKVIRLIYDRY